MRTIVILVLLAVGGLLAVGTFITFIGRWRADADRVRCADNLRHICQHYLLDDLQKAKEFPAGTVKAAGLPPEKRLSWIVPGLVRLGHGELGKSIDLNAAWDAEPNKLAAHTFLPHLVCPGRVEVPPADGLAPFDYPGIAGVGAAAPFSPADAPGSGIFRYDDPTRASDVEDGLANTLMLLESSRRTGPWIAGGPPTVRALDPGEQPYIGRGQQFGGAHLRGANAAMADGSGRFINQNISPRVLDLLAGIADGSKPDDSQ